MQRLLGGGLPLELSAVCHQGDSYGGHGDLESGKGGRGQFWGVE